MELQMLAWTHHPARHSKQIESAIDAGIGLYRCLEFLRRVQINAKPLILVGDHGLEPWTR